MAISRCPNSSRSTLTLFLVYNLRQVEVKLILAYKAMYKYLDDGIHAEVLDFPGTITWGKDLDNARLSLASALVDMAETNLELGEPLPQPDPNITDPEADLEEPIYLLMQAASRIAIVPQDAVA